MTEKKIFSNALSGKPESMTVSSGKIYGYLIRNLDLYPLHLYTVNVGLELNIVRKISEEYDDYWVIKETLNPLFVTKYLLYKRREAALEHIEELNKELKPKFLSEEELNKKLADTEKAYYEKTILERAGSMYYFDEGKQSMDFYKAAAKIEIDALREKELKK